MDIIKKKKKKKKNSGLMYIVISVDTDFSEFDDDSHIKLILELPGSQNGVQLKDRPIGSEVMNLFNFQQKFPMFNIRCACTILRVIFFNVNPVKLDTY